MNRLIKIFAEYLHKFEGAEKLPISVYERDAEAMAIIANEYFIQQKSLSHTELCRLSLLFNHNADLANENDRNINEWLKAALGNGHQDAKPCDHRWIVGKDKITRCRRCRVTEND